METIDIQLKLNDKIPCAAAVLTHGSLFSGIGGFDLAAHWVGWNNVFQCEKDDWCRKVLAKNFPDTKRYEDIKKFNAKKYEGTIDVISGGFPCQPFSVAGNKKGKDDDRYLWEEMLRIIREVKPSFVVGENVPGIIGMALDTVLFDLENEGYTTETYIIPACAKNAWHRRDRVWIIAYSNDNGNNRASRQNESQAKKERIQKRHKMEQFGKPSGISTNAKTGRGREFGNGEQTQRNESRDETQSIGGSSSANATNANNSRRKEQRQQITDATKFFAPKCSSWWEAEPAMGRVVDGLPKRVDRTKGLGNAIVPQIAYEIFSAIRDVLAKNLT